jgi:predicted RNase H-like HicB family nuclease
MLKMHSKNQSKEKRCEVIVKSIKYYVVILHKDTEDGGYWVECPAIPGCASQGETIEEALSMIKDAIQGCTAVKTEAGAIENG